MAHWKAFLRLTLTLLTILILLPACGGSDNSASDEVNDPTTNDPDDSNTNNQDADDPNDPQNQDPSILKVSDIRTAATPDSPITVFNNTGDGLAVWAVRLYPGTSKY